MKHINGMGCVILCLCSLLLLNSCATTSDDDPSPLRQNLLQERWIAHMNNMAPNGWTQSADRWYFTGEPKPTEREAVHAPISDAMTIMAVRVSQFNKIHITGNFQIQILGNQEKNTVFVLGSNEAVSQAAIAIRHHTLYVSQRDDCESCYKDVIVRIGINQLNELCYTGDGSVTGRYIISDHLSIIASGYGNILLGGYMNVADITQYGLGTVTIMDAYTPHLNIRVIGNGNLNMSGRMGVEQLIHAGNGQINIVGADTHSLIIKTQGNGITQIAGYADVRKLVALGNSQVYLYWVNSRKLQLTEANHARVGLAGVVGDLHVSLYDHSWLGGQYLRSKNAYITTQNASHGNVTASNKLFAAAQGNSSLYYFSAPNRVSRFMSQKGIILPAGHSPMPMPTSTKPFAWNPPNHLN